MSAPTAPTLAANLRQQADAEGLARMRTRLRVLLGRGEKG